MLGASIDLKMFAVLLLPVKCRSAWSFIQQTRLLESFDMKCLKEFTSTVVDTFKKQWLRRAIAEEVRDIES